MADRWYRDRFNRTVDSAANLLYPNSCPGCDVPISGDRNIMPICEDCGPGLESIVKPYCRVCGQAFTGKLERDFRCSNCADRKLAFDFAVGGYSAHGLARRLMHRYKYERKIHLVRLFGRMMEAALSDERIAEKTWVLVPVPLHRRRFRDRGFNQAMELCRVLRGRNRDRFSVLNAIRRVRHTPRQAGLDRDQRLSNLQGAFALARFRQVAAKLKGRGVLLVDDVLTTGATASECARVLKESTEVAEVGVITVLRG